MIRHIVLWRLNGANPVERLRQAAEIKAALEGLNGRIPGLLRLEVGFDYSGTDESADICLYSEFASREALSLYHEHPEHLKVAPLVKKYRTERWVADFEAND
jgi:hypothetical protein